ncbi:MAG: hypothetical protein A3F68_04465 [Acidobacteria bacterium RIFCSPLOWO2_12_FULL_54_10]|nr:MAG: hypothetical protein A3F68_04465 [Acidobacteria bacterium RIFCSPLOWO2_12_FULL_54_10]
MRRLRRIRRFASVVFTDRSKAVLIAAFFCFQFSRFYLIVPLNGFECFEPNFLRGVAAMDDHSHHHEAAAGHAHAQLASQDQPQSQQPGFAFEHCKDTYNGIALTPVQSLGMPVDFTPQFRLLEIVSVISLFQHPAESFSITPYPPPKQLS